MGFIKVRTVRTIVRKPHSCGYTTTSPIRLTIARVRPKSDLSAAFDTIDHTILLRRLSGYGLSGDVIAWLTSYLCDRTYVVRVKSGVSESDIITTGVPQGTVLGPLLFNAYIAPLTTLLQKHNIRHQLYADDTQLYITFPPTDHTQALARMEAYVQEAKAWLVMNNNKSQAIVIHSSSLRTPTSLTSSSKLPPLYGI